MFFSRDREPVPQTRRPPRKQAGVFHGGPAQLAIDGPGHGSQFIGIPGHPEDPGHVLHDQLLPHTGHVKDQCPQYIAHQRSMGRRKPPGQRHQHPKSRVFEPVRQCHSTRVLIRARLFIPLPSRFLDARSFIPFPGHDPLFVLPTPVVFVRAPVVDFFTRPAAQRGPSSAFVSSGTRAGKARRRGARPPGTGFRRVTCASRSCVP